MALKNYLLRRAGDSLVEIQGELVIFKAETSPIFKSYV
jgi:hypothetical protein